VRARPRWSKAGAELTRRGYRISAVNTPIIPSTSTTRAATVSACRKAGGRSGGGLGQPLGDHPRIARRSKPPLDEILAKLAPCDLVIVEGYKRDGHDKIEVRNLALDHPKLAGGDPTVVAIAANGPVADAPVPVFGRDDVTALAGFIVKHMGLP
jgi:molybdopterin-guanine dinucleotide biosynthesis protein B